MKEFVKVSLLFWAVMESVLSKALGLQKLVVGESVEEPVTEFVFQAVAESIFSNADNTVVL